jgi:F-type H+-transporting ATPase subunit delta
MAAETSQSESPEVGKEAQLGVIYAKALLAVTERAGVSESAVEELSSLARDVFPKVPGLKFALSSPRMPLAEKEAVLDKAFGASSNTRMTPQLLTFLKVVARHGRLEYVGEISRAAVKQLDLLRNRLEIVVRTASPLSSDDLAHLQSRLSAKLKADVRISVEIRPELIGGIVIKVGDTLYDASVTSQLAKMRTETIAKTVEAIRTQSARFAAAT